MQIIKTIFFELLIVVIITIPSFLSLLNNQYFSMHDDQHIVRLYLLDNAIRQNYFYPRWVNLLGFNFGYPLFNFYPPLVYYGAEIFRLLGFSFFWSIKLMFITGFLLSSIGIYLFIKKLTNRLTALLASVIYTYFFYHAVNSYVRGALAEFFSMAILPFLFFSLHQLFEKINWQRTIIFGSTWALLILNHPLIAFPSVFYIGFFFVFYLLNLKKEKIKFLKYFIFGFFLGISLSAFFWLPSMIEKKYTMIDEILTRELANYKIHYIYPHQFWFSSWGFGGSVAGPEDGMSFQIGKIYIFLSLLSIFLGIIYFLKKKKMDINLQYFFFFLILLIFSLFMTTSYSFFIWDNIRYLWYLQFPWRFLTFASLFIAIVGGYSIYFLSVFVSKKPILANLLFLLVVGIIVMIIFKYQKYFRPQQFLKVTDNQLTSFEEIAWRVSKTSFEFVPKGIKTTKSKLNTTILDINKKDISQKPYRIILGNCQVEILKNNFREKQFIIYAETPTIFRLNTYYFPGWTAYLNGEKIKINSNNDYRLITVNIPSGKHKLWFKFEDTMVRSVGNSISLISFSITLAGYILFRKKFK